jgi:hypothetical protein
VAIGQAFPLFGAGWGQLSYWHLELPFEPKMAGYLSHAHNLILHFWAEMGLLGLAWLAVVLGVLAASGVVRIKSRRPYAAPEMWVLAVLLVLGAHSMVELPLWSANFFLLGAYALGTWAACVSTQAVIPTAPEATGPRTGRLILLIGLAGLGTVAWVYADYRKASSLYDGGAAASLDINTRIDRAQSVKLFRPTVEFALANQTPINPQNAAVFSRVMPSLWRYVVDPRMFEWQLTTAAWQNDAPSFQHYAEKFRIMYPAQYQELKMQLLHTKTAPWLNMEKYWP